MDGNRDDHIMDALNVQEYLGKLSKTRPTAIIAAQWCRQIAASLRTKSRGQCGSSSGLVQG